MRRILAISGGAYFHHASFCDPKVESRLARTIHVRDLAATRLENYDIVILPCRIDPDMLKPRAGQLREFLDNGGTIASLSGENAEEYLPGIFCTPSEVNFWWWLNMENDPGIRIMRPNHPIFGHIGAGDVIWHYHGTLTPPPGAVSLVDVEGDGSLLYIDRATTAGRLIVSTLDPVFHHGSNFMPAATRLLYGLMDWLAIGDLGDAMAPSEATPESLARAIPAREAKNVKSCCG